MSNVKHGACKRNKRLYGVWNSIIHRCEDPKRDKYAAYGGRGIAVCAEWHNPNAFMDWAEASGYKPGLQLDRIDNDGDYCPENCQWATPKENCRHTSRTKTLTLVGQTKSVAEWCEYLDISKFTLYHWIRKYGKKECERRVYRRLAETA